MENQTILETIDAREKPSLFRTRVNVPSVLQASEMAKNATA
jgi:hypothetical protein